MVAGTDLLTVQCLADDGADIIFRVGGCGVDGCIIVTACFEQVISGSVKPVHILQRFGVHGQGVLVLTVAVTSTIAAWRMLLTERAAGLALGE